jgi:hypothetical protein
MLPTQLWDQLPEPDQHGVQCPAAADSDKIYHLPKRPKFKDRRGQIRHGQTVSVEYEQPDILRGGS